MSDGSRSTMSASAEKSHGARAKEGLHPLTHTERRKEAERMPVQRSFRFFMSPSDPCFLPSSCSRRLARRSLLAASLFRWSVSKENYCQR